MWSTTQFWMVWNPQRGLPKVKHDTLQEAKAEAARLARKHQGQEFVILQSVCDVAYADVICRDHVPLLPF